MEHNHHVHIVGGGFAGVQAARTVLRGSPQATVTMVSNTDYVTMLPALPDVFSRRVPREAITRDLLAVFAPFGERFELVVREIQHIDLENRYLQDSTGEQHPYTHLILASGSTPEFFGFPNPERLHTVDTFNGATRFLEACEGHAGSIVVVGGGYTGLETATTLRHGGVKDAPITVVDAAPHILPFLEDKARGGIGEYLAELDITVRSGVTLNGYDGSRASLSDGTEITNALVCWAAGMRGTRFTITPPVETTKDYRVKTLPTLQLPEFPTVFVAGDVAALEKDGAVVRRAINFAWYSGIHSGKNVIRLWKGRGLKPFTPVDLGWVIPLGKRSRGKIFGSITVWGNLALRLHYFMCGVRHFGGAEAFQFIRTAFRLSRRFP